MQNKFYTHNIIPPLPPNDKYKYGELTIGEMEAKLYTAKSEKSDNLNKWIMRGVQKCFDCFIKLGSDVSTCSCSFGYK